MGIYFFDRSWWILPLMGGVGGWFTNWIALKLIFEPVEPIDLYCYTLQGLFLKRQQEVSIAYASLISTRVLTAHNMLLSMLAGPLSSKLAQIVTAHVGRAVDQYAGTRAAQVVVHEVARAAPFFMFTFSFSSSFSLSSQAPRYRSCLPPLEPRSTRR